MWKIHDPNSRVIRYKREAGDATHTKSMAVDAEDHILHTLLNKKSVSSDVTVFNAWVKPPFISGSSFLVQNDKLVCNVSTNYAKIIGRAVEDDFLCFHALQLHDALIHIISHRKEYLCKFNKLIYKETMSLAQIFALFMLWLSEALHNKVAGYVIDFSLLLYLCIGRACDSCDINNYFHQNYIESNNYPELLVAQKLHSEWLVVDCILYIEPQEFVTYLVEYFRGIKLCTNA